MDFKEMVEADITSVFLNLEEFGEIHQIEGKPVICIIDRDVYGPINGTIAHPLEGLTDNALTLYTKADSMRRPSVGKTLSVDGSLHLVQSVSVEMGMLVIKLEETRGRR